MSSRNSGMPVGQGAIVGGGIFIVGLIVTFILGQVGFPRGIGLIMAFDPIFGMVFGFTAFHLWPTILGSSGTGSFLVGTIVPILLLIGGGYYVASQTRGGSGFTNGASVTVGYFAVAVLAFLYLTTVGAGGTQGMQIGLDFLIALGFTGLVFPVVFGGIGGALADSA